MERKVILTIDCGTQSLRGLLFSPDGNLLARTRIPYAPYASPRPGWAEQDPEIYWEGLCRACRRLKREHPDHFARIAGVGVTTQRNSMINVDRRGNCLRPAIIWLDQRKSAPSFASGGLLKHAFRIIRMDKVVSGIQAEGKCSQSRRCYSP